jgi:uncharacterized protein YigA (DUF484 family)
MAVEPASSAGPVDCGALSVSETSKSPKSGPSDALAKDWGLVSAFLREHAGLIRDDADLLSDLGLWIKSDNIVEFGPAALARLSAAKTREKVARTRVEATARANFAAQAQTHATVVDLLEARNHADLARRVDETARLRFGLVAGVIAIERPGGVPAGWRALPEEGADALLGPTGLARMGEPRAAQALFDDRADQVASVALVRMAIWTPARQGVLAFGSPTADGFTKEMGSELVAFLCRVVERTAERWPAL